MSTVPEEIVPWLQPQATKDPAIVKIPALSAPATETVYVPFNDELVKPPVGGGVGLEVPLPPPQPANTARAETVTARRERRQDDMIPPNLMGAVPRVRAQVKPEIDDYFNPKGSEK